MKVYLAGPINGCSDEEAFAWRARASVLLRMDGHTVIDPAARDYRGQEATSFRAICKQDKAEIAACDVLLANCWKVSVGTSMEILLAYMLGLRVIVMAPGDPSPWLMAHAHAVVVDLEDAVVEVSR